MEVMEDHVHIFVEVPPRYSPAQTVQILKGVSAREVFKKFPKLRKQLWAREFLSDNVSCQFFGLSYGRLNIFTRLLAAPCGRPDSGARLANWPDRPWGCGGTC